MPAPASSQPADPSTIAALEQLRRRSDTSYEGRPACDNCRRRKTKCDRQQPACGRCTRLNRPCTSTDVLMRRGPPSNKERAAYEAAGLQIPSLKHRQRTRRAQSSAITSARYESAPFSVAPAGHANHGSSASKMFGEQPYGLGVKLAPPSSTLMPSNALGLPSWSMRPREDDLAGPGDVARGMDALPPPPSIPSMAPPPTNFAQASSSALPLRSAHSYAPPYRVPYPFGATDRAAGAPSDPSWFRDLPDPRRLCIDDRMAGTSPSSQAQSQPQPANDWSIMSSPLSLSFADDRTTPAGSGYSAPFGPPLSPPAQAVGYSRPPISRPLAMGSLGDDLPSTAYGAAPASGSSNASVSSTSTASSASVDTATNTANLVSATSALPSVANGLVAPDAGRLASPNFHQDSRVGTSSSSSFVSLYSMLQQGQMNSPGMGSSVGPSSSALPAPKALRGPEPFAPHRLDHAGPMDATSSPWDSPAPAIDMTHGSRAPWPPRLLPSTGQ